METQGKPKLLFGLIEASMGGRGSEGRLWIFTCHLILLGMSWSMAGLQHMTLRNTTHSWQTMTELNTSWMHKQV